MWFWSYDTRLKTVLWELILVNHHTSTLRSLFEIFEEVVCKSLDCYRENEICGQKYRSRKDLSKEISTPSFVLTFTFRWCDRSIFSPERLDLWTRISWERKEYRYKPWNNTRNNTGTCLTQMLTLLKVSLLPFNELFYLHFYPFASLHVHTSRAARKCLCL